MHTSPGINGFKMISDLSIGKYVVYIPDLHIKCRETFYVSVQFKINLLKILTINPYLLVSTLYVANLPSAYQAWILFETMCLFKAKSALNSIADLFAHTLHNTPLFQQSVNNRDLPNMPWKSVDHCQRCYFIDVHANALIPGMFVHPRALWYNYPHKPWWRHQMETFSA